MVRKKQSLPAVSCCGMLDYPLDKVFQLIEPGPVVMVSTADAGKANLMTMSWHMMLDFTPPQIVCSIGPWNHSLDALLKTKQCVIAIPGAGLLEKTVEIGNCSGRDMDKFARFGLTPLRGENVCAPLVGECLWNLECRVIDSSLSAKYNMIMVEARKAWSNPAVRDRRTFHANGDGTFVVDGETLNLKAKMVKWPEFL